jgi:hypothetical protein
MRGGDDGFVRGVGEEVGFVGFAEETEFVAVDADEDEEVGDFDVGCDWGSDFLCVLRR